MANVIWDADNADHRRAFATALAPLVAVLWKRKEPFGMVEARIYMRTLKNVPSSILVSAIEKALELEEWFPEPAKLLNYAADLVEEGRKAVAEKWLTDDCEECHGSRWVGLIVDGVRRESRCGCWKRAITEMAEIGQPLKRKQLPATNPNVELV